MSGRATTSAAVQHCPCTSVGAVGEREHNTAVTVRERRAAGGSATQALAWQYGIGKTIRLQIGTESLMTPV
jgi:hypothetical protein